MEVLHNIRTAFKAILWNKLPLSPTLDVEIEPGAFGTENLANETGLNDVGFLTEPLRV